MASITKERNKFRVHLAVSGHRESKVFNTKSEANLWAKVRTSELISKFGAHSKPKNLIPPNKREKRTKLPASDKEIFSNKIELGILCGIYFLLKDQQVVYVGQSTNIFCRVADHLLSKEFDSFSYFECDRKDLTDFEAAYINKYKPKLNVVIPRIKFENSIIGALG